MLSREYYREMADKLAKEGGHTELATLLDMQLAVLLDIRALLTDISITKRVTNYCKKYEKIHC